MAEPCKTMDPPKVPPKPIPKSENDYIGSLCRGPNAPYVRLISSDGHVFVMKREMAINGSPMIRAMLSGPGKFSENETNEIHFRQIPSHILREIGIYFMYKSKYTDSSIDVPQFEVRPEIALEVLLAANFLEC